MKETRITTDENIQRIKRNFLEKLKNGFIKIKEKEEEKNNDILKYLKELEDEIKDL